MAGRPIDWRVMFGAVLKTAGVIAEKIFDDVGMELVQALVVGPAMAKVMKNALPPRPQGIGRLAGVRALSKVSVDGAVLEGVAPGMGAKFTIPKGLPEEGETRLAVENEPHVVDGFDGEIPEGYGKGTKTLLYHGPAIVKRGGKTRVETADYHFHEAERAGPHYDLAVTGTRAERYSLEPENFEIHFPQGPYKGRRFAVVGAGMLEGQGGRIVVPMRSRTFTLPKPAMALKDRAWLAEQNQNDFIVERKMDGCFPFSTRVNTWDGGSVRIGDIVNKGLDPILVGCDDQGNIVPCRITGRLNSGRKRNWMVINSSLLTNSTHGGSEDNDVVVTDNHHISLNGEFKAVAEAKVGDLLIGHVRVPDARVLHVVRSGLLGDGCLSLNGKNYRYDEGHKKEHLAYVEEVRRWLGDWCIKASDRVSGYGSEISVAASSASHLLSELREEWYPDGTKIVPSDLSWMDDFSVARWYMDDGALMHSIYQRDRAVFATNGFTEADVRRLGAKLEEMYGVSCSVQDSKGWSLRVNAGFEHRRPTTPEIVSLMEEGLSVSEVANELDIDRSRVHQLLAKPYEGGQATNISSFWERIAPFVCACMRYKLPEQYRSVAYVERPLGGSRVVKRFGKVLEAGPLDHSKHSRRYRRTMVGFDIETSTGNYFCRGILVHNSLLSCHIQKGRVHMKSHRFTGGDYYDKLPALEHLDNHSRLWTCRRWFQADLNGTMLLAEAVHSAGVSKVSGVLNSSADNAMAYQEEHGPVEGYVWDIARYKGRDVSQWDYTRRRGLLEKVVGEMRRYNRHWRVVEKAAPGESPAHFYDRVVKDSRGLPFSEGVVAKDRYDSQRFFKVKGQDAYDLEIAPDGFVEGTGKYAGSLGAVKVVGPETGAIGEVGSLSLPDSQRQFLWDNREGLQGAVVRVRALGLTERGLPRAGVLEGLHPDKGSEQALAIAAASRLAGAP